MVKAVPFRRRLPLQSDDLLAGLRCLGQQARLLLGLDRLLRTRRGKPVTCRHRIPGTPALAAPLQHRPLDARRACTPPASPSAARRARRSREAAGNRRLPIHRPAAGDLGQFFPRLSQGVGVACSACAALRALACSDVGTPVVERDDVVGFRLGDLGLGPQLVVFDLPVLATRRLRASSCCLRAISASTSRCSIAVFCV